MSANLSVIILAAGQGTRMRSSLPKVLHPVAGKAMVRHVIDMAQNLGSEDVHLIYGHGGDKVKEACSDYLLNWVLQAEQLGTGHAVQQVVPHLPDEGNVLILYGDVPMIRESTLKALIEQAPLNGIGLLTVELSDPTGYGRIKRDESGQVKAIVEHKDADESTLMITEGNTGIMYVPSKSLKDWLSRINNQNAQGEYYLTDIIALCNEDGLPVRALKVMDEQEVEGVNNREQLARMERYFQARQAKEWMARGVTIIDPSRVEFRGDIEIGEDVTLDINVILEGAVSVGRGSRIGANAIIIDSKIGEKVVVKPNTIVEGACIGNESSVGPFARIRPGTELADDVHIGNFVEIKKSTLSTGSKAGHLAYIGDAEIGKKVNVGAGTITCNYDGANKHKTILKDHVFVGSDTQLVAPVTIGEGVTIGAGTTVTGDVSDGVLVISRVKQREIPNYKRPQKKS